VGRPATAIGIAGLVLLALCVRATGLAEVFREPGEVILRSADSSYHARRALYGFVNFPSLLTFDPYIAYPDGAEVPMPPLYTWSLSATARLLASGESGFERVAAWWTPLLAALTVLPVFAIGRAAAVAVQGAGAPPLAGAGAGLLAAFLFALLPASSRASSLGDVDHHAAVALLGACQLAASLALLRARARAAVFRAALGLACVLAALVLSWSGSLLLVGVGAPALLLAALLEPRRGSLFAVAAAHAGAAALVLPWLLAAGPPAAGAFTTTNLSWFHVLALLGVGSLAGLLALCAGALATFGIARRLLLALGLAACVSGLLSLAFPGVRDSLAAAAAFLLREDSWGERNLEQQPLLVDWGEPGRVPTVVIHFGWLAPLLPLAPLALLSGARARASRAASLCLVLWSAPLTLLAFAQSRFCNELTPVAAAGFAVCLLACARPLRRLHPLLPLGAAAAVATALLWPGLEKTHARRLPATLHWLQGGGPPSKLGGEASLVRFARMVRQATPETAGFLEPDGRPEYSVLAKPSHGHTLNYEARRATPANNFGPYLDREKYLRATRFLSAPSEREVVAIAEGFRARYVMTFARENADPFTFHDRLHGFDGVGPGRARPSERMRLVTEGPRHGDPLRSAFPSLWAPMRTIPYKLFELVRGAQLQVVAEPGTRVLAELEIETPLGRRFHYRQEARVEADGRVALRVPYATQTSLPTRPLSAWGVWVGSSRFPVALTDADVREGRSVRVGAAPAAAPAP
jgi:dolichyl-diphosphooligosaccharide--protein glycosyltransferase